MHANTSHIIYRSISLQNCIGYVSQKKSIKNSELYEILDDIFQINMIINPELISGILNVNRNIAKNLQSYYLEQKIKTSKNGEEQINNQNKITKYVENNVRNFWISTKPLVFFSKVYMRTYPREKLNYKDDMDIIESVIRLNDLCLHDSNKRIYNIPSEIRGFRLDTGIHIKRQTIAQLIWNEKRKKLYIQIEETILKTIEPNHRDYGDIIKSIQEISEKQDLLKQSVEIWSKKTFSSHSTRVNIDLNNSIANIEIDERKKGDQNPLGSFGEIFHLYHTYDNTSIDFNLKNGWMCPLFIKIQVNNLELSDLIRFFTKIPVEFNNRLQDLLPKSIEAIIRELNLIWKRNNKTPKIWKRKSLIPYFQKICINTPFPIFHNLLGRLLESKIF